MDSEIRQLILEMLDVIDGLQQQQAMPDDSADPWREQVKEKAKNLLDAK